MKYDGSQFVCCYDTVANGQGLMQNVQLAFKDSDGRIWFSNFASQSNDLVILDALATEIEDPVNQQVTNDYGLFQNYPNPFNPKTTISFYISEKSTNAQVIIFNILGKEVMRWNFGEVLKGTHKFNWYGEDSFGKKVSSGVYFYRLETDKFVKVNKMLLLK